MPRKLNESTMDYLGRTLDALGLRNMGKNARLGHYDDFLCPEDVDDGMNINRLVRELRIQHNLQPNNARKSLIREVIQQAIDGEFDATPEESNAWAASPDGQKTFRELFEGE